MAARVTRQHIEVLISNTAGNIITESVTSTLALTSTAAHSDLLLRSVISTMSLTSTAGSSHAWAESVSQTLSMTDSAVSVDTFMPVVSDIIHLTDKADTLHQPETDTLSMSQSVTCVHFAGQSVSQSLGLSQSVTFEDRRQVIVPPQSLGLTQTIRQNFQDQAVNDPMSIVQTVDVRQPYYLTIHHRLNLGDLGYDVSKDQSVTDFLNLSDAAGLEKDHSASTVITLTQLAYNSHLAASTLVMSQTVVDGKGGTDIHKITVMDHATLAGSQWNRPSTQPLNLIDGATYYLQRQCTTRQYSPFVGGGGGAFTPPPTTAPAISRGTLTLTFPFVSPSTTLVLRNPEFGNKEAFVPDYITRRTLGGSYIAFADPNWVKIKTNKYTIRLLKKSVVDQFNTFLHDNVGKEIGILDYENRQWRGIITNPDSAITQDDRSHWTINIEFEGELA